MHLDDPGRVARGSNHRRRYAIRRRPPFGCGILVLARHDDHGRRVYLCAFQESRRSCDWWKYCGGRCWLRFLIYLWMDRREDVPRVRAATQLFAVCVVANSGRRRRPVRTLYSVEQASGEAAAELTSLPKSPQIRRHDCFDCLRFDAETLKRAQFDLRRIGHDIVNAKQFHLVRSQRWLGKILQDRSLHLRNKERQRYQQPVTLDCPEHELHEFLECPNVGSTKFINRAWPCSAVDRIGNRPCNVADEYGLKTRQT